MGLSQLDSSLTAKVEGTFKFTSRRDYQEAMAPRATSEHATDSDDASQTRPPVLRLRGAGTPDHGESDCRSEDDSDDISYGDSESSCDESSTYCKEEEQCNVFGGDMPSCLEYIPQPDQHSQDTHPDAAAGFEGDMSSTTECIPWSDQQSESLGSKVPVMRLRGVHLRTGLLSRKQQSIDG